MSAKLVAMLLVTSAVDYLERLSCLPSDLLSVYWDITCSVTHSLLRLCRAGLWPSLYICRHTNVSHPLNTSVLAVLCDFKPVYNDTTQLDVELS